MSPRYISKELRQRVIVAAQYRCGYCLTSQFVVGPLLEIDHIIPLARGGTSEEGNLWLTCPRCNGAKSVRIEAVDPHSGELVRLFNPRVDVWSDHFSWSVEGTIVEGKSAIGRATIDALNMNRPENVIARELWVNAGWHPPID